MSIPPLVDRLESRRFLTIIAPDVTWGQDGYIVRNYAGEFAGRSGDGFLMSNTDSEYGVPDTTTVSRYTDAGTADPDFHTIHYQGDYTELQADAQGRVLLGSIEDNDRVSLQRYTLEGILDSKFGSAGNVSFYPAGKNRAASTSAGLVDIAAGPDGSVFVMTAVGVNDNYDTSTYAITKFLADGTPDTSFGRNGTAPFTDMTSRRDGELRIDPNGRVFVSYTYTNYADYPDFEKPAITRLTAAGAWDNAFGNSGRVVFSSPFMTNGWDVDAMGRLVVVRRFGEAGSPKARGQVLRFNTRGRADKTFGRQGLSQPIDSEQTASDSTTIVFDGSDTIVQLGNFIARLGENGLATSRGLYEPDDGVTLAGVMRDDAILAVGVEHFGSTIARFVAKRPVAQGTSGILYVSGSSRADNIRLSPGSKVGTISATVGGKPYGVFSGTTEIQGMLKEGDDTFLAPKIAVPMTIDAGAGDDTVATGSGRDIIELGVGSNAVDAGSGGGRIAVTEYDETAKNIINAVGGRRDDWFVQIYSGTARVGVTGGTIKVQARNTSDTTMVLNAYVSARVSGSDGVDRIYTGRGNDSISGFGGDDIISTGTGRDTLNGGDGFDRYLASGDDDSIADFEAVLH